MPDPIIAHIDLIDGTERPDFEQLDGEQYMLDDECERIYGVWFIPRDNPIDLPQVIPAK